MTKKELIKRLKFIDDDAELFLLSSTGDYWGNELALPLKMIKEELTEISDYHDGKLRIVDRNKNRDGLEDPKEVMVLGY